MRIDHTVFGEITIDGKTYNHDVIIRLSGGAHSRVDDVVSWLSGHGVVAFGRVFRFPEREEPFKKLEQYGPDLFVAGAYGHARLHELIFGGFTDNFLKHCTRGAFLSH